jgi:hypothetical protein
MVLFVAGEEIVPGVVEDLPEGRCAWSAWVMDGGHECPWEHCSGQRRAARCDGVSGSLNIGISPAIQPESHGHGAVFTLMLHDTTSAQDWRGSRAHDRAAGGPE